MKIQTQSKSNYQETGIDCQLDENGWLPKLRNRKHFKFTVLNCYDVYKQNKKSNGKPFVSKKQYMTFLEEYFRLVLYRIIEEGFILILPYHMGRFYIHKSRRVGFIRESPISTKRTMNLHSFRKFYNLKWDKSLGYFKNRNLWKYISSSTVKKDLAAFIFKNNRPVIEKPLIGHGHKETKWG